MTRKEWIEVLDKAIEKARVDYYDAQRDSSIERDACLAMRMLKYVKGAMVEVGETGEGELP